MLCLFRSRHNNGQPFITIVDRAEQCPAATTVIEIHQSEVELASALPNDLQSVADVAAHWIAAGEDGGDDQWDASDSGQE